MNGPNIPQAGCLGFGRLEGSDGVSTSVAQTERLGGSLPMCCGCQKPHSVRLLARTAVDVLALVSCLNALWRNKPAGLRIEITGLEALPHSVIEELRGEAGKPVRVIGRFIAMPTHEPAQALMSVFRGPLGSFYSELRAGFLQFD